MQRFRLHAGAAIHVDFKSVPYADADVLEWRRRMLETQAFYKAGGATRFPGRVTHAVVRRTETAWNAEFWRPVYADDFYVVYRMN